MAYHRFDRCVVVVRCGHWGRHHVAGIEDVEAFILHGAEVEVVGRHDHEAVEVKFEPEAFLIPEDGLLKAREGPGALFVVLFVRPDLQQAFVAVFKRYFFTAVDERARDERKEVTRLFVRVFPPYPVAAFGFFAAVDEVAVAEEHGVSGFVGVNRDREAAHDVGAIRPVRDGAEALRLTLTHEGAAAHVDAGEIRIFRGGKTVYDHERRLMMNAENRQGRIREAVPVLRGRRAVNRETFKRKVFRV